MKSIIEQSPIFSLSEHERRTNGLTGILGPDRFQSRYCRCGNPISFNELRPGDLVFFNLTAKQNGAAGWGPRHAPRDGTAD